MTKIKRDEGYLDSIRRAAARDRQRRHRGPLHQRARQPRRARRALTPWERRTCGWYSQATAAGLSIGTIAWVMDISISTARRDLRALGLAVRASRDELGPHEVRAMHAMHSTGMTFVLIAKVVGRDRKTVAKYLRRK